LFSNKYVLIYCAYLTYTLISDSNSS